MFPFIVFFVIVFLLELYIFQAVKAVTSHMSNPVPVYIAYWLVAALGLVTILGMPFLRQMGAPTPFFVYFISILMGIFIAKVLASGFFAIDDMRRLVLWVADKWNGSPQKQLAGGSGEGISRSAFLSWIGIAAGTTLFGTMLSGFTNQYKYKIRRVALAFPNLPANFKGFKVVQISDIHSGSFMNKAAVQKGVDMINALEPDVILFTGDLVNDRASEMEPYKEVFQQLKATHGVFSVLGNHDYGDYFQWPSAAAKAENLQRLQQIHAEMGWQLLNDTGVLLERNGDSIGLLGVQNISGKGGFHSYGNMAKAYADTAQAPFKMLMSHDPSHWEAEVTRQYPDIDITFSGHTHGMQFGVELPGFKWSPVKWVYKHWAGLYEQGQQKLYVNRGFGFIGYPGRVGILPEITLVELGKQS